MEWKIIEGFTDYKVSENGDVYSIKRNKMLRQYERKNYLGVYLYCNNKRQYKMTHRLVASAFISNPNNLPQVNHKDENSRNNNVNNLEWCTAKYNCNYGNHIVKLRKRMTENNPSKGRHHTKEAIEKMRLKKIGQPSKRKRKIIIDGIEYESITEAMNKLNISTRKLYKILKDETKKGSDMR